VAEKPHDAVVKFTAASRASPCDIARLLLADLTASRYDLKRHRAFLKSVAPQEEEQQDE